MESEGALPFANFVTWMCLSACLGLICERPQRLSPRASETSSGRHYVGPGTGGCPVKVLFIPVSLSKLLVSLPVSL